MCPIVYFHVTSSHARDNSKCVLNLFHHKFQIGLKPARFKSVSKIFFVSTKLTIAQNNITMLYFSFSNMIHMIPRC
jgi:hypothetical protein